MTQRRLRGRQREIRFQNKTPAEEKDKAVLEKFDGLQGPPGKVEGSFKRGKTVGGHGGALMNQTSTHQSQEMQFHNKSTEKRKRKHLLPPACRQAATGEVRPDGDASVVCVSERIVGSDRRKSDMDFVLTLYSSSA